MDESPYPVSSVRGPIYRAICLSASSDLEFLGILKDDWLLLYAAVLDVGYGKISMSCVYIDGYAMGGLRVSGCTYIIKRSQLTLCTIHTYIRCVYTPS